VSIIKTKQMKREEMKEGKRNENRCGKQKEG
jgi:hypothetical protein